MKKNRKIKKKHYDTRIYMYSVNFELEKKKKEEERRKKVDELLKKYDENQKENLELSKGSFFKKYFNIGKNKLVAKKHYISNSHARRLLICMLPVFATIGTAVSFWFAGFVLGEISNMAAFLQGITLPASFTGLIGTTVFWQFTGVVAIGCLGAFLLSTIFVVTRNAIRENKLNKEYKRLFSNKRQFFCEKKTNPYNQYYVNKDKNIDNFNYKTNKNDYSRGYDDFSDRCEFDYNDSNAGYKFNNRAKMNKDDKNRAEFFSRRKTKNFDKKRKKTFFNKNYDGNSYHKTRKRGFY